MAEERHEWYREYVFRARFARLYVGQGGKPVAWVIKKTICIPNGTSRVSKLTWIPRCVRVSSACFPPRPRCSKYRRAAPSSKRFALAFDRFQLHQVSPRGMVVFAYISCSTSRTPILHASPLDNTKTLGQMNLLRPQTRGRKLIDHRCCVVFGDGVGEQVVEKERGRRLHLEFLTFTHHCSLPWEAPGIALAHSIDLAG